MIAKNLVLSGLKRQRSLILELIGELENKSAFDQDDSSFLEVRAFHIAKNLRLLRQIKDRYARHMEESIN